MESQSVFGELWLQSHLITGLVLTYRTKSALKVLTTQNQGGLGW